MKISQSFRYARLSAVLAVPVLALSFTIGGPNAGRADNNDMLPHVLRDMVFSPIMNAVQGMQQRLSNLESSVAALSADVTSQRVASRQVCLADDSGAQTCITKAQLDTLLRVQAQTDIPQPAASEVAVPSASPDDAQAENAAQATSESEPSIVAADAAREESTPAEPAVPASSEPESAWNETPQEQQPAQAEIDLPAPAATASAAVEASPAAATSMETAEVDPAVPAQRAEIAQPEPVPTAESTAEANPVSEPVQAELTAPAPTTETIAAEESRSEEHAQAEPEARAEAPTAIAAAAPQDQESLPPGSTVPAAAEAVAEGAEEQAARGESHSLGASPAPISLNELELDPPATIPARD
jgi:hypothetical protein